MNNFNIIDLFSGCGGLSLGFIQNGYKTSVALEYDKMIASTYKANHPDINVLIDDIKKVDASGYFNDISADVIVGGPPCQGFSMAGARIRSGFIDDPRNYLFKHYFNIVKLVKPKVFIMENVKGMMTMQDGKIFKEILNIFSSSEMMDGQPYKMWYKIVKAVEFGIPQKRERLIIIGTLDHTINIDEIWEQAKETITKKHPTFFNRVTVLDAISNLPLPTENGIVENPKPLNSYQAFLATGNKTLENHIRPNHNAIAIDRMKRVRNGENYTVLNEKINSVHSGSYGRLEWDEPAPTITTRFDTPSGGRFIHPTEDRTLTPREAARIQSFPDGYVFKGNKSSICRQIGNAVPPKISYFLAYVVQIILSSKEAIK